MDDLRPLNRLLSLHYISVNDGECSLCVRESSAGHLDWFAPSASCQGVLSGLYPRHIQVVEVLSYSET